jgi:hypothetical protein
MALQEKTYENNSGDKIDSSPPSKYSNGSKGGSSGYGREVLDIC